MADRTCSIEACQGAVKARGWCNTHYCRWRQHGDPLHVGRIRGDDRVRWWSKVTRSDAVSCWEWTGAHIPTGYAQMQIGGTSRAAHRVGWELLRGPVPNDPATGKPLELDHLCRNRGCVNPEHLDLVTHLENMRRSSWATAKTCKNGHPWTEENTWWIKPSGRVCRECRRIRNRRWRARHGDALRNRGTERMRQWRQRRRLMSELHGGETGD